MKTRRIAIVAFLLIACLTIGIGYAAINGSLTINGKAVAGVHSDNFKVTFDQTKTTVQKNGATITNPESGNALFGFTYGDANTSVIANIYEGVLTDKDDVVTITFTVQNESEDLKATLTPQAITQDNADYFEVTTDFATKTLGIAGATDATTTVTVTVKLLKTLADSSKTCDFQLVINTTAVEVTA